ncbi:MAG: extracellular solute-binding protein [Desulfosarcinaceae bacterium]|nr:extracellular solute-binding protein [Desulfosarcinaceae bacterium]
MKPSIFARISEGYESGKIDRRSFLRLCAAAGVGFSSPYFQLSCSGDQLSHEEDKADALGPKSAGLLRTDQNLFLQDIGKRFSNLTLRVISEDTPPSKATIKLMREEFSPVTGVEVEWELLPLDRVLAKIGADIGRRAGTHDVFYMDQAWIGRFYNDCISPLELMEKKDVAYPDYRFNDILPAIVKHVSTYKNQLVSIPYDIPIFITMYRKDILDDLQLKVPGTLEEYMEVVKAINDSLAPNVYGTTAAWKSGHYGLECNMTAWLWGHGGSIYAEKGQSALNDENAHAAMMYMLELGKNMAPGVTTWDWYGESESFAQGQAGIITSWCEYFPVYDDPARSKVVGLAEAVPCPLPNSLRSPEQCSFGEVPGVSHQGGSSLAVSKYSKHVDAAWVFVQWATSSDVTTRACVLGGGSSPIRLSNYKDPRVNEKKRVGAGTTRHFDIVLDAIQHHMGTEPHLPGWPSLATDVFAVELGKMTTGQQGITATLDKMKYAADSVAEKLQRESRDDGK